MAAFCVVLSWLSIKGRSALEGRHLSKCQQLIHHWLNTIRRFAMKHARAHTHTLKKGNMPIHTNIRTTATFTKFTKSQMAGKQSNRPPSDTLQDWQSHPCTPAFVSVGSWSSLSPTGYEGCVSQFNSCRVFCFFCFFCWQFSHLSRNRLFFLWVEIRVTTRQVK